LRLCDWLENSKIRHILTRASLAIIFIGIGIWEIVQPSYWATYFPSFITSLSYALTLVMIHGAVLLILGIAVMLGLYLRISSLLCVLMMLSVIIGLYIGFGFTDLIIRDTAVLFIAVALFFDDTRYLRLKG
jgi:uncharacterized membrane protein YphA (DoxX/SURF4 family)